MVLGDYPADPANPPAYEDLVSNVACQNCHGGTGQGIHYSYPMRVQQCTVCHDSTSLPTEAELFKVVHGIHNSESMPTGEYEFAPMDFRSLLPDLHDQLQRLPRQRGHVGGSQQDDGHGRKLLQLPPVDG